VIIVKDYFVFEQVQYIFDVSLDILYEHPDIELTHGNFKESNQG
jgi:hypothetical protein